MNINIVSNKQLFEVVAYVESESKEGLYYKVEAFTDNTWRCTCPQNTHQDKICKHILVVKVEV